MRQVVMETKMGRIIAEVEDNGEYHNMYIYLERRDGLEVDLVKIDANDTEKKLMACVYENVFQGCTETFEWDVDDINELDFNYERAE